MSYDLWAAIQSIFVLISSLVDQTVLWFDHAKLQKKLGVKNFGKIDYMYV